MDPFVPLAHYDHNFFEFIGHVLSDSLPSQCTTLQKFIIAHTCTARQLPPSQVLRKLIPCAGLQVQTYTLPSVKIKARDVQLVSSHLTSS
jgi:hypothetical protein